MPADQPRTAVISGHGLCLRLERDDAGWPGRLRLDERRAAPAPRPDGRGAERHGRRARRSRAAAGRATVGRPPRADAGRRTATPAVSAGPAMHYRDLLPAAREAGSSPRTSRSPTADRCRTTSTTTASASRSSTAAGAGCASVYEDQGQPFVLEAGDCVLQPSGIRHRVLESSAGLEVIEVTSPAEHPTHVDHDLPLPTVDRPPGADASTARRSSGTVSRDAIVGAVAIGRASRPGDSGIGRGHRRSRRRAPGPGHGRRRGDGVGPPRRRAAASGSSSPGRRPCARRTTRRGARHR